jgi:hypothetical protein
VLCDGQHDEEVEEAEEEVVDLVADRPMVVPFGPGDGPEGPH